MGFPKASVTLWLLSALLDWTTVVAVTRQEASQLEEFQWYNTLIHHRRQLLAASSGQSFLEYGNTFDPDSLASRVFTGELDLEDFRSTRKVLQTTSTLTDISPSAGSASPVLTNPTTVALASPQPPASPSNGSILANVESGLLTAGPPPVQPATVATPPSGGATLFYNPGRKLMVPQ